MVYLPLTYFIYHQLICGWVFFVCVFLLWLVLGELGYCCCICSHSNRNVPIGRYLRSLTSTAGGWREHYLLVLVTFIHGWFSTDFITRYVVWYTENFWYINRAVYVELLYCSLIICVYCCVWAPSCIFSLAFILYSDNLNKQWK